MRIAAFSVLVVSLAGLVMAEEAEFPWGIVVPTAGEMTSYGIPLSLENAQIFADWYHEINLTAEEEGVVNEALEALPAICCDDHRLTRCCCELSGLLCNLVRSARGLAHFLVREKGFRAEEVRAAVEEWLKFLRPEYFLARAAEGHGEDPAEYGLSSSRDYQSCYLGRCNVPLTQGGCGGMGPEVKL